MSVRRPAMKSRPSAAKRRALAVPALVGLLLVSCGRMQEAPQRTSPTEFEQAPAEERAEPEAAPPSAAPEAKSAPAGRGRDLDALEDRAAEGGLEPTREKKDQASPRRKAPTSTTGAAKSSDSTPSSRPASPADAFTTLAEAEAALRNAEGTLERLYPKLGALELEASGDELSGTSACAEACRAFDALRRAAEGVCRLDRSGAGARCERANALVREHRARVRRCGCS